MGSEMCIRDRSARGGGVEAAAKALETLAVAYWRPIYAWIRGQGLSLIHILTLPTSDLV